MSVICLLLSLSVPIIGAYTWLHWQIRTTRKEVKRNIVAGLDRKDLTELKFSKTETRTALRWEHSREFEYQGNMYDIVSTELRGDSVFYLCWWDRKETLLKFHLAELVSGAMQGDAPNQERQLRLLQFMKCLYLPDGIFLPPGLIAASETGFIPPHFEYASPAFSPPFPPPEAC